MIVIMMMVVMTITMVTLSPAWTNDDDGDYDTSTSGRNDQSKQPARDDTQRAQLGSAGIIFQRYK